MPNNVTVRIKSAPKHLRWVVAGAIVGVAVIWSGVTAFISRATTVPLAAPSYTLRVGEEPASHTYHLTAAVTAVQQEQGLSKTAELRSDQGMIFVNDAVTERCFWMKDMRYSLDILWLDASKKIVAVKGDISPSTYPQTYCAKGQYVIEIKAGEAALRGFRSGQRLSF